MLLGVLVLAVLAPNWGWLVDRALPRMGRSSIVRRWPWWPSAARAQMTMTPRLRKFVLAAHVTSSVGSLGAVAVFLALAFAGLTSQDAQLVRAAYVANGFVAWRSEEHTSELQSLMRNSYAVFSLTKQKRQ